MGHLKLSHQVTDLRSGQYLLSVIRTLREPGPGSVPGGLGSTTGLIQCLWIFYSDYDFDCWSHYLTSLISKIKAWSGRPQTR